MESRYFLSAVNPYNGVPTFNLVIHRAYSALWRPECCKPVGKHLELNIGPDVGEKRVLDFEGRHICIRRLEDDDRTSYFITL